MLKIATERKGDGTLLIYDEQKCKKLHPSNVGSRRKKGEGNVAFLDSDRRIAKKKK